MRGRRLVHLMLVVGAAILIAAPAWAQAPVQSQGPLTLLPLENRIIIAPDVKITDINGATGTMIGGYAGIEIDKRFFTGGAGYWLVNADDAAEMFYVGFLAGWQVLNTDRFHVGARGLLGVGEATVYYNTWFRIPIDPRINMGYTTAHGRAGVRTGIWVAEPELRAEVGLSQQIRLGLGLGYRFTGTDAWLGNHLDGVTGSISLQIGLGK